MQNSKTSIYDANNTSEWTVPQISSNHPLVKQGQTICLRMLSDNVWQCETRRFRKPPVLWSSSLNATNLAYVRSRAWKQQWLFRDKIYQGKSASEFKIQVPDSLQKKAYAETFRIQSVLIKVCLVHISFNLHWLELPISKKSRGSPQNSNAQPPNIHRCNPSSAPDSPSRQDFKPAPQFFIQCLHGRQ
jgi:hypothetical protein